MGGSCAGGRWPAALAPARPGWRTFGNLSEPGNVHECFSVLRDLLSRIEMWACCCCRWPGSQYSCWFKLNFLYGKQLQFRMYHYKKKQVSCEEYRIIKNWLTLHSKFPKGKAQPAQPKTIRLGFFQQLSQPSKITLTCTNLKLHLLGWYRSQLKL